VSSLELAFIAPTLLALIFFIVQGALYFYGRSVALQAAREGVSQLRILDPDNPDGATAICTEPGMTKTVSLNTQAFAGHIGSGALTSVQATATCHVIPGDNASTVTVEVRGNAISIFGWTMTIDEKATGRVEQFQDEAPQP
jgi:Flp pilus assembly protein TadG